MRIHYLVEGQSEAELLERWLKRALPGHDHKVYPHRGKGTLPKDVLAKPEPHREGLLDQLPAKLRAYGKSLNPATDRLVVLVDADNDDPQTLLRDMGNLASACHAPKGTMFCVAVEETEAFYLGDPKAIQAAFGKFNRSVYKRYVQDSICGTWEVFRDVVGWRGEAKVKWAKLMAGHLGIATTGRTRNRSPSFERFHQAIRAAAGEGWP